MNDSARQASEPGAAASPLPEAALRAIERRAWAHGNAFMERHRASLPDADSVLNRFEALTRLAADRSADPGTTASATRWAQEDAADFARMPAGGLRINSAVQIAENTERSPLYAEALARVAPDVDRITRTIATEDRARSERTAEAAVRPGGSVTAARQDDEARAESGPGRRAANPPLQERFDIRHGLTARTYRFRDTARDIAMVEGLRSISTRYDTPVVAKAIVDRAVERGWQTIRVNGSPAFNREVWRAAQERGVVALGYEPTAADRQSIELERQRASATQARASRTADRDPRDSNHAALRALEQRMERDGVPPQARPVVREAARRVLADLQRQGRSARPRVYDLAAARSAAVTATTPRSRGAHVERTR